MRALNDGGQRLFIIETTLALSLVSLLIVATFQVLWPFVGVLTYAVILATATSGLFERSAALLRGRRHLAAVLFGAIAFAIVGVPLVYLSLAVADLVQVVGRSLSSTSTEGVPDLPEWIGALPVLGAKATSGWLELQSNGPDTLQQYQTQITAAGRWLLNLGVGTMGGVAEILLGVVVAAMIHASGHRVLWPVSTMASRIAGPAGDDLLDAAGRAVRGVAIGVIGTSLLEGGLAWVGFAVAGVPHAGALAVVTFLLALIQVGPLLVWLPVAIWLGSNGEVGWAVFVAIWGVVMLMGTDGIVKPLLIARSGRLPALLLFVGVIGGLVAWGFTGMFIGATTLAILWTVLQAWLGTRDNRLMTAA
jgi:predicted PurR-regulated permease PerM